ncbi:PaaI family thioesterase [Myxococcota bacterium]|nr:PaaI family thioesterase [Myxococcota bacterium]
MPDHDTYPPKHHFFRDLGLRLMIHDGHELGILPLQPAMARNDQGLPMGAIATLVDMVTGREAQRFGDPTYPITSDMDLRDLMPGRFDEIRVTATLLHRGRRSAVLDAAIFGCSDAGTRQVGTAQANFALFPPEQEFELGQIKSSNDEIEFQLPDSALSMDLPGQLGIRVLSNEQGHVEVDVEDYVKNPLGVLQGGVHAVLAEVAAELRASHDRGRTTRVSDLSIRYLAAARFGPIRAEARFVDESRSSLLRVDITDTGAEGRLVTTALVGVV